MGYPSIPTFQGKKIWLLVMEESTNYSWHFFLREKSNLASVMMGLVKNFKIKYNMQVQYLHCVNAGENVAFKKA